MIYFKRFCIVTFLVFLFVQAAQAFYSTNWIEVCGPQYSGSDTKACKEGINQVLIDADSVNIHNDSVYYAIEYYTMTNGGVVAILQSKNGKVGIVETFSNSRYEQIIQNSVENEHPVYAAGNAKNLKELSKESFMSDVDITAHEIVTIKRFNPYSMHLHNGLYDGI